MTAKQVIEMGTAYAEISNAELARRLGWSPQILNNRMVTGKFSVDEWQRIAEALGAKLNIGFTFSDGKTV